jgi:hypothetical protein
MGLLDLGGPAAAPAGDPQQFSLNVGNPLHPDQETGWSAFAASVVQVGLPAGRSLMRWNCPLQNVREKRRKLRIFVHGLHYW